MFKKKSDKKKQPVIEEDKPMSAEDQVETLQKEISHSLSRNGYSTSFFYTNDYTLDAIDDQSIIDAILKVYPGFKSTNDEDTIKATLIQMIQDQKFMDMIFKHFNIDFSQFIKIIYPDYSNIFRGQFLTKFRSVLQNTPYGTI